MTDHYTVRIITPETSTEEIIELSMLSGPSDEAHYKKLMHGFIENSLSEAPDLDKGIVYGLYDGKELLACARIKQDEYTSEVASIEYLAVQPDRRGEGLGKRFMEGMYKEIKERWKKKVVMLATGESRPFYEKIGMSLLGELPLEGYRRFYMYQRLG